MRIPPRAHAAGPVAAATMGLAAAGIASLVVLLAAPAAAHVTVHADNPTQGASDVAVTFRVPNETAAATVTRLSVQIPTTPPLLGVLVRPHPGWTSSVTTVPLNTPAHTDDGTVTQAVSQITWTATTPSAGIPVGDYDDFDITVGQLPSAATVTFKAVQTYSDGQVARWIAPTTAGQPESDDPAPTLTLSPAGTTPAGPTGTTTGNGASTSAAQDVTGDTSSSVPAATTVIDTSRDTTARTLAAIALGLAIAGTAGGFLAGRRSRAPAAPHTPNPDAPAPAGPAGSGNGTLDLPAGTPGDPAAARTRASAAQSRPASTSAAVPDHVAGDLLVVGPAAPATTESSPVAGPGASEAASRTARLTYAWPAADRTSQRLLVGACLGAALVAVAAFLPWVTGTLSDRGAALLTVHRVGISNPLHGRWTLALAITALALTGMLAARPAWRTRALILAADGLAITIVAAAGRHDGASVARELIHHKIGTGEIVNPTSAYTTAYGWWLTLAGGLTLTASAIAWYTRTRPAGHPPHTAIRTEPTTPPTG